MRLTRLWIKFWNWCGLMTLNSATRKVLKENLTYLTPTKLRRVHRALRETKEVEGDIVEFGVALGGSGVIFAQNKGSSRRFLGFDVFKMIPPPTSEKDGSNSKDRYQIIRSGASKGIRGEKYYGYRDNLFLEVKDTFNRHGVPVDGQTIVLYQGLFEETWPTASVPRVALAHIDCDWYDPARYCLHAIADKMSEGGIVIIDDYNDWGGCRTAVDEFVAERNDFVLEKGSNPFLRRKVGAAIS
jgi:O-methyltransferase